MGNRLVVVGLLAVLVLAGCSGGDDLPPQTTADRPAAGGQRHPGGVTAEDQARMAPPTGNNPAGK